MRSASFFSKAAKCRPGSLRQRHLLDDWGHNDYDVSRLSLRLNLAALAIALGRVVAISHGRMMRRALTPRLTRLGTGAALLLYTARMHDTQSPDSSLAEELLSPFSRTP